MDPSDNKRRRYGFVLAIFSLALAILFAYFVGWLGYIVVVRYFAQDPITFWVAIAVAILIWFIEEMLHLTIPCRRALRRLAHWLTERWIDRHAFERKVDRAPNVECDQLQSIRQPHNVSADNRPSNNPSAPRRTDSRSS